MSTIRVLPKLPTTSACLSFNVWQIRRRRDMTQQELADRVTALGVKLARTQIAKIEDPRPDYRRDVSTDELVALAIALDVSPLRLLLPESGDPRRGIVLAAGEERRTATYSEADESGPRKQAGERVDRFGRVVVEWGHAWLWAGEQTPLWDDSDEDLDPDGEKFRAWYSTRAGVIDPMRAVDAGGGGMSGAGLKRVKRTDRRRDELHAEDRLDVMEAQLSTVVEQLGRLVDSQPDDRPGRSVTNEGKEGGTHG